MARAIDGEAAYRFLSEQLVKETGAFSKGVNKGLNIARSAMRNPDAIPTLTPPNEPLTLEQLREMDGEPVFVVIDDGIEPLKMWALVEYIAEEQCLTLTNNLGGRSQYYTADDLEIDHITAYRRPPEGEKNT